MKGLTLTAAAQWKFVTENMIWCPTGVIMKPLHYQHFLSIMNEDIFKMCHLFLYFLIPIPSSLTLVLASGGFVWACMLLPVTRKREALHSSVYRFLIPDTFAWLLCMLYSLQIKGGALQCLRSGQTPTVPPLRWKWSEAEKLYAG